MAATQFHATVLMSKKSRGGGWRHCPRGGAVHRGACAAAQALALLAVLFAEDPAAGASNKVRIGNLTDVAFGTVANLGTDAIQAQNVCVYSDTATSGYNVTATGTGPSGSFQLSSGTASMPYDVLWSSSAGQNSGTRLTANVPLTGQVSSARQQTCNTGAANSASLVVVLRSVALSSATAGTYNGTLTLVIGPE